MSKITHNEIDENFLQDIRIPYIVNTETIANIYTGTDTTIKSYYKRLIVIFEPTVDSSAACTVNINNLGAKAILDGLGNPVTNLKKNIPYTMVYNGTAFILQGKGGGGDALASQILAGKKASTDVGLIVGSMANNGAINKTLGINGTFNIPEGYTSGGVINQNIPLRGGAVINPTTVDQYIEAGQYINDRQIIKGDPNLIPENIVENMTMFNIIGNAKKAHIKSGTKALKGSDLYKLDLTGLIDFTPDLVYGWAPDGYVFVALNNVGRLYYSRNGYSSRYSGGPWGTGDTIWGVITSRVVVGVPEPDEDCGTVSWTAVKFT